MEDNNKGIDLKGVAALITAIFGAAIGVYSLVQSNKGDTKITKTDMIQESVYTITMQRLNLVEQRLNTIETRLYDLKRIPSCLSDTDCQMGSECKSGNCEKKISAVIGPPEVKLMEPNKLKKFDSYQVIQQYVNDNKAPVKAE